jgi:hypothetical protein
MFPFNLTKLLGPISLDPPPLTPFSPPIPPLLLHLVTCTYLPTIMAHILQQPLHIFSPQTVLTYMIYPSFPIFKALNSSPKRREMATFKHVSALVIISLYKRRYNFQVVRAHGVSSWTSCISNLLFGGIRHSVTPDYAVIGVWHSESSTGNIWRRGWMC